VEDMIHLSPFKIPVCHVGQAAIHTHKTVFFAPNALTHIKVRHWYKNTKTASYFLPSMNVNKLKVIILKTLNKGQPGKTGCAAHKVRECAFKKFIGHLHTGEKCYSLRVVTTLKDKVITAFPI
jgi:hypothetical protein